jgi:hypothetical protein
MYRNKQAIYFKLVVIYWSEVRNMGKAVGGWSGDD